MKKIYFLLALCSSFTVLFAQVPQSINYQAVVRSAGGSSVVNTPVDFRITILDDSINGTPIYREKHVDTTNAFGLVNLKIGQGAADLNTFANINWAGGSKFMRVETDIAPSGSGNVWTPMGTSQFLSVPYALYAGNSYWQKNGDSLSTVTNNVGIGTASPAAKLDVAGDVKITDGTEGSGKVLTADSNGKATWQRTGAIAYGLINGTTVAKFNDYGITGISRQSTGNYTITCSANLPANVTAACTWWDTNGYGFISYYQSGGNSIGVRVRNAAGVNVDAVFSIVVFGN